MMEKYLEMLFEFQSFEHNKRLDKMIKDTEERASYGAVDDELLNMVAGGIGQEDADFLMDEKSRGGLKLD